VGTVFIGGACLILWRRVASHVPDRDRRERALRLRARRSTLRAGTRRAAWAARVSLNGTRALAGRAALPRLAVNHVTSSRGRREGVTGEGLWPSPLFFNARRNEVRGAIVAAADCAPREASRWHAIVPALAHRPASTYLWVLDPPTDNPA
jgi:hypothetical protein